MTSSHPATLPPTWTLRSVEIERDAEALAAMWNASDDQWPGTWTGGVPMTAARVREWFAREGHTAVMIWDTGEAIAGYCSLWRRPEEANVTYIALLNVAPAFQGRSLARHLLTEAVSRSIALGATRLDLGTWSGNLKAVPLYKKCGFFWLPGTSVDMHNYLPGILVNPLARRFFDRHAWYTTFQRSLTQTEDDERWEGLKVFTYRFVAGEEGLTIWIDRSARTITAVETDRFQIASLVPTPEPARGLPTTLGWRLINRGDQPLPIALVASGDAGLALDHRASLTLAAGASETLVASVAVAETAPSVAPGKPAPAVRSLLVVDGQLVELATGLSPRAAVAVTTDPPAITLTPGREQSIALQLRNHLPRPAVLTVGLLPPAGLTVDWASQTVTLPEAGTIRLPLRVHADGDGVLLLSVALTLAEADGPVALPATTLSLFSLPPGGCLGALVDGQIRLENEQVRLTIEPEGGRLTLTERHGGARLVRYLGYPAPPTWPSEYQYGTFTLRLETTSTGYRAEATLASVEHPQFWLRRQLSFGAGPVISIEHEFENRAATERRFSLYQWVRGDNETAQLTLPLAAGLTQATWSDFPGEEESAFQASTSYGERWAALTFAQATVGLVWSSDVTRIEGGTALTSHDYVCPAHTVVRPGPLWLVVSEAGWPMVRRLWQRLSGQAPAVTGITGQPTSPLTVRVEPPAVVAADQARLRLTIEHRRSRPLAGHLTLELPADWRATPTDIALGAVTWQQPRTVELTLATDAPVGPATAWLRLRTDERDEDLPLPLLRLGDGRAVTVDETVWEGQRRLTIDNGRLQIVVTPDFGGTVSGLREDEIEHLASGFPRVGTFGWLSPWYGGLSPVLLLPDDEDYPGRLHQVSFAAAAIEVPDDQGLPWRGVQQHTVLERPEVRGLELALETLTLGGSPVIKQVVRLTNPTAVSVQLANVGWLAFVQPDGERTATVWGPREQVKHSQRIVWLRTGAWAAAQNPRTGRTLMLVSPDERAGLSGWGADGNHLALGTALTVPASSSVSLTAYLALADDLVTARGYLALAALTPPLPAAARP